MRITQEVDYAFRICAYLAEKEGQIIGAPTIAYNKNIPERFTLRILRKLKLAGIVEAKRGVSGGYLLNSPKEELNLYDIIVAIDGPILINRCLRGDMDSPYDSCDRKCGFESCTIHTKLAEIQINIVNMFKESTLDKFMEQ